MARVELADIPEEPGDVEDYLCALFHAAGWCVETGVVLRDEGVEILEIDARAVQLEERARTVVLSEAKSGGWGAPDIFKLLGWQSYLGTDRAVFASTRSETDIEPLRRHAPDNARFTYPAKGWVVGRIGGRDVVSLSARQQRIFHTGYELTEVARHDMALIERHERCH